MQNILCTKIISPPRHARILPCPRVTDIFMQAFEYRLTIIQAEAGYGKSTALAELAETVKPLAWYQFNEEDSDSLIFLLHLCHALSRVLPNLLELPLPFLETRYGSQGPLPWRSVIDQIINAVSIYFDTQILLVLDDAHIATDAGEVAHIIDRLVGAAPANLHLMLSGRHAITLPSLSHWRSQGEVMMLDQATLTFTADEIASLFAAHYGFEVSRDEVDALVVYTEGWAIALQLIWQSICSQSPSAIEFPLHWKSDSLDTLFEMLTREVFERQPADVRTFLLISSTLRDLRPEACDALRRAAGSTISDSASMLAYLRR